MTSTRDTRETRTAPTPVQRTQAAPTATSSTPLRGELRASSFAEGEARLAPGPAGSPSGGGAVQRQTAEREGAGGAPTAQGGASLGAQVPGNVDLQSARVSFTLPAGRKLAGSMLYDASTRFSTQVTLQVSPDSLRVYTSPPLPFDVQFPAANMSFYGAGVRFASGEVYANFHKSGVGIDVTATGRDTVVGLIGRAIAGTPMARPGYNPMTDPELMSTLMRVKGNFDALPEARAGAAGVSAAEVSRPTIGATLAMRTPFLQEGDGASVRIPAGGQFDVSISGTGNLAAILAAGDAQGAAMAAGIRDVSVSSEAIELVRGGEPIARLQRLRIAPGGAVTLEQFRMLGGLGAGAGFEALVRLLAGGVALAGQGVPLEAGVAITAQSGAADPEITRGVSRSMIERGLTAAVQQLLRDNRNAVPGLDLGLVFGAGG